MPRTIQGPAGKKPGWPLPSEKPVLTPESDASRTIASRSDTSFDRKKALRASSSSREGGFVGSTSSNSTNASSIS